jgi:hypothetical protein
MNIQRDSPLVFVTAPVCLAVRDEMKLACVCEGHTRQFLLVPMFGVSCTGSLLLLRRRSFVAHETIASSNAAAT